jgi:hypothetical protein
MSEDEVSSFYQNGENLENDENKEWQGNKFQGDIQTTSTVVKRMFGADVATKATEDGELVKDTASLLEVDGVPITDRSKLWPGGILFWKWTKSLASDTKKRAAISAAMSELSAKTPLIFQQVGANHKGHYVHFFIGGGCYSYVGMTVNLMQPLSIGNGCGYKMVVQHEIMHALGFWHEQSSPDRDNYVVVNWDNIKPDKKHNFKKQLHQDANQMGVPYDLKSIMHYNSGAFSKNGKPTIVGKKGEIIPYWKPLASSDIRQISKLYNVPCIQFKDVQAVCKSSSGECEMLVNSHLGGYQGSCKGYCESHGQHCARAWNDDGNTCTDKRAIKSCNDTHGNDLICSCVRPDSCPSISTNGRCGPLYNNTVCGGRPWAIYCNTQNGWCGNSSAHKHAQPGNKYDNAVIPSRCRKKIALRDDCIKTCEERGFCCHKQVRNAFIGSNQHISCAQACDIRSKGISRATCRSYCPTRKCAFTIAGSYYNTCRTCVDTKTANSTCPLHGGSQGMCEVGCDHYGLFLDPKLTSH